MCRFAIAVRFHFGIVFALKPNVVAEVNLFTGEVLVSVGVVLEFADAVVGVGGYGFEPVGGGGEGGYDAEDGVGA